VQHERAGEGKVKRENNLQGDRSFNDLQNMLFLASSLAQVAKEQMTVLGRFGVHICITFWVEVNGKKFTCRKRLFRGGCCIHSILYWKNVPPCNIWPPWCEILAAGLTVANVTTISWVKFYLFGRHNIKNNWYTMLSITACPALQHSAHIFSAKPANINALW